MAFGNVNSVSAAKSTTKSTPYGTLKGFISYAVSKDVTDYDIYYEDYGNNSFKVE